MPSPSSSRPRDSTSAVAAILARYPGARYGMFTTATPSRIRWVTAAR